MNRDEVFKGTGPASGTKITVKIGASNDGKLTACQAWLGYEAGAFAGSPVGAATMTMIAPYQFENLLLEGYDVVYGVRTKREMPIVWELAYKGFYRIFHKVANIRIPVDAGDFSLIDRKVMNVLNQLPERDRFVRGLDIAAVGA